MWHFKQHPEFNLLFINDWGIAKYCYEPIEDEL